MVNVIKGTNDAERIDGTWAADEIYGRGGDDTIFGGGGGDAIFGGGGNDSIRAAEDDTIYGGAGDDQIIVYNVRGDFEIYGGVGDDTITLVGASPLFAEKTVIDGGKGFDTIVFGGQNLIYKMDIVSVERFVFDRDAIEIRAREDQIFHASGKMKVEVVGANNDSGPQHLTIATLDGRLDASKLFISNWDANDVVGLWGDAGDDLVIGSDYVDYLIGWAGNDTLDGGGGADHLQGGAGADVFVIDAACGPDAIDTIVDFAPGEDRVLLKAHGMGAKEIAEKAFHVGTEAADKADRLIYDRDTGALYFDRDGSRSGFEAVKIAQLQAGLDLTHEDFLLG